jgi:hypothetical protein
MYKKSNKIIKENENENENKNNDNYSDNDDDDLLNISRNTNKTCSKLFNIPAACEIEEYNYLFIDLFEFLNFHSKGFHLRELQEFLRIIALSNKSPKIVINFPNILFNVNIINLEIIDIILSIMSNTDIFLFDKKECLAFFNMLSQMNNEKDLPEKNLFEYFTKEISHIKTGVNKISLFMDNLQKLNIIENKGKKIFNQFEYLLNLYPKINHTNQKVVDEYKKILSVNNNYFKPIFFGGFFSKFIFYEDYHTAFLSGLESVKRILELFKHKIDFPIEHEFYIIKHQKNKIYKNLETEFLKKKEEKFVLDCINKKNSVIKSYNPLFDKNLNAFFSSHVIRKQLKQKNFIDTNGFVLFDKGYKDIIKPKPKINNIKMRLNSREKKNHLLHAIRNNQVLKIYNIYKFIFLIILFIFFNFFSKNLFLFYRIYYLLTLNVILSR